MGRAKKIFSLAALGVRVTGSSALAYSIHSQLPSICEGILLHLLYHSNKGPT
jgi:hypothetical protein